MYLFVVVIADKIAFLMNESLQLMDYLKWPEISNSLKTSTLGSFFKNTFLFHSPTNYFLFESYFALYNKFTVEEIY